MTPESLLEHVRRNVRGVLGRAVVFSGTVPVLGGQLETRPFFAVEIADPRRRRSLSLRYKIRRL